VTPTGHRSASGHRCRGGIGFHREFRHHRLPAGAICRHLIAFLRRAGEAFVDLRSRTRGSSAPLPVRSRKPDLPKANGSKVFFGPARLRRALVATRKKFGDCLRQESQWNWKPRNRTIRPLLGDRAPADPGRGSRTEPAVTVLGGVRRPAPWKRVLLPLPVAPLHSVDPPALTRQRSRL